MSTTTPVRPHLATTDASTPLRQDALTTEFLTTMRRSLQRLVDTFELNRIDEVATHGVTRSAAYDVGVRCAVHEALHDLEVGRYGDCRTCGAQIDVERLQSVPYARRCGPCQRIEERRWNQIERMVAGVIQTQGGEPQGRSPIPSPEGRVHPLADARTAER